jgi:hypothetical protein
MPIPTIISIFHCYFHHSISPDPRQIYPFRNLAQPPAGGPPLVECLYIIFAATLHSGGRYSIHDMRTRRAVVTGTRSLWGSHKTQNYIHIYVCACVCACVQNAVHYI